MSTRGPLRVGVGGPVGSGKTALVERLCKAMRDAYDIAVVTNDIYTKEDAEFLTRAGLDADDALHGQRAAPVQELRVFLGVDVVGDDGELVAVAQPFAEGVDQRRFAGAHGSGDSESKRLFCHGRSQERKRRLYWVS